MSPKEIAAHYEGKVFEYPELNEANTPIKLGQAGPPSPCPTGAEAALKGCNAMHEGNGHDRPTLD